MDDENNLEKSDSTDEVDEKSDTETECFDKEDLDKHKKNHHPMFVYRCTVNNCPRWFSSRRSRDKHSDNVRSRLHKSGTVKPPPTNAIFIENASTDQLEIVKNYNSAVNRAKGKRGPKPKFLIDETEKNFLVGLPRDQLKRRLMESVVEKLESSSSKKSCQGNDSSPSSTSLSKRRASVGQLSHSSSVTIPNVSSPRPHTSKSVAIKIADIERKPPAPKLVPKLKPIPNFSHLKVPLLPLDNESFSLPKFSEDLITLLTNYDGAEYFRYPLIDHYAPGSSQLLEQITMDTIKMKLKQGHYSKNITNLRSDLLKFYSNGIHSFDEKSLGWQEAAKLYQTTLINIQNAEKKLSSQDSRGQKQKKDDDIINNINQSATDDSGNTHLHILNPYNNGKLSDHERVMSIGEHIGKLKSATQYLNNFKEDRRNKISILSYLDYGANFSFGPCYDSGNAYCTKEVSDLLIRGYGDQMDQEEEEDQYRDLNEIIPEPGLGDDFSLYLMNVFTRDILRASVQDLEQGVDNDGPLSGTIMEPGEDMVQQGLTRMVADSVSDRTGGDSRIQHMLDCNSQDLKQLKLLNYQRLSNLQVQPSNDEWIFADKVTTNLTTMIAELTPESVTDRSSIRKVLDLVL